MFENIATSANDHSEGPKYGGRGESLFSLSSLAHLTIVSRHQSSEFTYEKSTAMDDESAHTFSMRAIGRAQQGTIVVVKSLFVNLPVRRRAIRIDQELVRLKELMRTLSVAHHTVNFNLYPLHKGKALLELPTQSTLLDRLSQLHNQDVTKHFVVSIHL